jgi:hypothetical protein
MTIEKEYLGDGLYAHYDDYHIVLTAPRQDGDHHVGLEPAVLHNLFRYVEKVHRVKISIDNLEKGTP